MKKIQITKPSDVVDLLARWQNKREENFLAITLNGHHDVVRVHHVSKGLANKTIVHPRECFYPAIKDNAVSIIFAHNHPSGNTYPSPEDDEVCERLVAAGEIIGIQVLDFIVIAKHGLFYSYGVHDKLKKEFSDDEFKSYTALFAAELREERRRYAKANI